MRFKIKFFNKIRITMMTLVIALSTCITSVPIKADASYTVNFGAPTGISYTASGPALDGTNTTDWNANYPILLIGSQPVFCLDPSQLVYDGVGGYTISDFPVELRKQMNLIGLHGYFEHGQTAQWYMASQFMMWELRGWTINTTNLPNYAGMKAEIQDRINHHYDKPNFINIPSSITVGETITLIDTNNVLSRFDVNPIDGVTFNKNGNQLSITTSINAPDNLLIVLKAYALGDGTTSSVVYRIPGMPNQVVGKFNYQDPVALPINLRVDKFGSLKMIKQDEDGTIVSGTSFNLSKNADMSSPMGSFTTGVDGSVTKDELLPGTYYLQETAVPSHLVLDSTIKSVVIKPNETTTYTATNNWIKGYIKVVKKDVDTGKTVVKSNTTFSVYKSDDTYVQDVTTDASGMISTGLLRYGDYYLIEKNAPDGYTHSDQVLVYQIREDGNTYTAELSNKRVTGSISIKKEDSITGSKPQGEATLQGAVYEVKARTPILDPADGSTIYAKDTVIKTLTTDVNADASASNLYLGKYYVKEKKPSKGYTLDPTEYDVTLSYADQNTSVITKSQTVKEKVIDGDFKITKVIEVDPSGSEITKPEKDAEFIAVLKKYVDQYGSVEEAYKHKDQFGDKEYDLLVTDKDGEDTSKKLAYGTYMVKQTKVGDENVDLLEKPFEVKIENENQPTIKYVVSNQKFLSYLQLEKKDAETGKTVTLSKTSFKIYDVENDKYLSQRVGLVRHDTWTTDETGKVTLPLKVPAGKYRLEEIKAPAGYLLNTDKVDFVMKESNVSIVDDEGEPIQIVVFSDSKPTGSTKLIKSDKVSAETLSGVQYQLTAAKDIIDPADGSIIHNEGDPISMDISENGYYLTNELGEINVEGLPLGSYTWKETKALDGYVQDKKEYTFELKQKDDIQKVYTHEQELTNQKTKVEILKEDVKNNALVGAHLRLVDEDENIVKEWISKKGPMKLEGLLVGKEYTLYEDEAPSGYVISKPVKFKIKNTMDTQEIKLIDNQISASKTDVDGTLLSGAKMQVVSTKTKNVVDEWTSKEEAHYINNLVEGQEYILRELEAPKGYVLAKDITFVANDKKEVQSISMIDKQVTALKLDEDGNVLPGAKMQVVSTKTKEIVDEWTSTEKEHNISNLIEGNSYILRELEAPEGLELADDIEFTVNDKKNTQTLEMSDNYILTTIQVNKVDSITKEAIRSKEFEFTAFKDKDCKDPFNTVNADTKEGTASFKLRFGEWWIKETKAPVGYLLSDEVKHVVINKEGVFVNEKKIDEIDTIYSFIYFNSPLQDDVVKTGDATNIYPFVFLGILSCFAYIFIKLKRKE